MGALLSISVSSVSVLANTENNSGGDFPEIYVDEDYGNQTNEGIQPRNRGNCTDFYTREWCNAHGYQNNRPVGGTVALNAKEKKCYLNVLHDVAWYSYTVTVKIGPAGLYVGPAAAVFKFFYCML